MLSHSDNYAFAVIDYDLYGMYISILNLKCINHAGKLLGTALETMEKKVRIYIFQMMQSVAACTGNLKSCSN